MKTLKQCKNCPQNSPTFTQTKGKHFGLFCSKCKGWITWLEQGTGDYELWFGIFKGKKIKDIELVELRKYYNYMADNVDNMKDSMKKAFMKIKRHLEVATIEAR